LRSIVVLEHFCTRSACAEVVEGQGEQTSTRFGPVALAVVIDAKPRRGGDFPDDREITGSQRDHAQGFALAEDTESESPCCRVPSSKVAPLSLEDILSTILGAALGPRRQERPLVWPVHALGRQKRECRKFLLAGQVEFKSRCGDDQAVLGPEVSKHGIDNHQRFASRATAFQAQAMASQLATELAPIRLNAISPGIIDSGVFDELGEQAKQGLLEEPRPQLSSAARE
jgi:hypothetical protein